MKQIYHYLILLTCILPMMIACESDDSTLEQAHIVKSNVNFEAKGGTGMIEVSTDQISAISDQEWCKAEVIGNTVKITVPQNSELGGRTALIIIHTENKDLKVPVTQVAPVFTISSTAPLDFFGNDDQQIELKVQSSLEITVSPDDDWIKYEQKGNSIIFTCTKSDIPMRSTKVKITSGAKTVTLDCKQTCIEGVYSFAYTNTDWDDIEIETTLTKDPNEANTYILKGDLPFGREFKLKYENNKLAFHAGQDLGTETIEGIEYHLFFTLGYGSLTPAWDSKVDYIAPMEFKKNKYFFEFVDGKNWGRYFVSRASISTFTGLPASESTYKKEEFKMAYIIMTVKSIL